MNTKEITEEPRRASRTKIQFDLSDELTPQEVEEFERSAEKAAAPNLTEHFLNLTIRPSGTAA
jgi:hypothetical protein